MADLTESEAAKRWPMLGRESNWTGAGLTEFGVVRLRDAGELTWYAAGAAEGFQYFAGGACAAVLHVFEALADAF
jgi:hypothetical protein